MRELMFVSGVDRVLMCGYGDVGVSCLITSL